MDTKVTYITKTITIRVPICPKCKKEIETITSPELRALYNYRCNSCGYKE